MKSNAFVLSTITNDYHVEVATKVYAEWNMNRYYRTLVDNTPIEDTSGYDIELFPIESIVLAPRPTSGICKAVAGQAYAEPRYNDGIPAARFYTCDPSDPYKYWQSPESAAAVTFLMSNCEPQVFYVEEATDTQIDLTVNKISFTIENTYAEPAEIEVQVKTASGAWSFVADETDFTIPASGKVELWYNGTTWTTTPVYGFSTTASAVRLVVDKMDKEAYFNLIELGLRLERDLTADLVGWSDTFNMGEADFITPLGQISSNTASVTLFNGDMTYSNGNASSPYFGILDKGVRFRCFTDYSGNIVQEFEMYADAWDAGEDSVVVQLTDQSKFFMDTKVPPVLYRDVPVQEAVWRICDIIGYTNVNTTTLDTSQQATIGIFWTEKDKTAWEILSDLARATQTAIYFDSLGTLQVKTRDAAWDNAKASSYTFNRDTGVTPANIITLSDTSQYEANKATVNYKPTGFSERRDNIIPYEVVWEPEGTQVLRATPLAKNLLVADSVVYLSSKEGKTWPWKGIMNVEGEFIRFDAKYYTHYVDGVRTSTWVTDYDQQKKLDERGGVFYRHMHAYTGALRITERGVWNTVSADHYIDLQNWSTTRRRNYSANHTPCSGIKLNSGESTVTVSAPKNSDMQDYTYLHHGNEIDDGYKYLGFRMKMDKGALKDRTAGFFFNGGTLGSGYYVEVMATARMSGKMRNTRNEVQFYSMKSDGTKKVIGGERVSMKDRSKNNKNAAKTKVDIGARLAVPLNKWIDFDIWYKSGTDDTVKIFANGKLLFTATITNASGWKQPKVSRMGVFSRGHSSASFEYAYGINSPGVEMIDSEYYFDRINGGYYSTQAADWTFGTRDVRRKIRKRWQKIEDQKYAQRFFDDFGPIAHEVREYDVEFSPELPVLQSKIYFSNTSQAVCPEYVGDVSGGTFIIANISRQDAIISGDDEATAMGNGTINHKLFVYGRPVVQKDSQKVEKTDELALRRRGPIEIEYDSPWIQNEDEANRFADWLTTHWSDSDSSIDMEVFGNPLIELTDVVHVNWRHINDLFYVVGINNVFENGLTTTLNLRKVTV